jgi:hypothetical protein
MTYQAAVGLNDIIQQLILKNQELEKRVELVTEDHKMMGKRLEEARGRELVWRSHVGALREEVASLRARLQEGHHYGLAYEQRLVLGELLGELRPIPGVMECDGSRMDEAVGLIRYEAVLNRREYVKLVQVYLNACKHF